MLIIIIVTLNNKVKIVLGQFLGHEDPKWGHCLRVEALPEPLSAGLVYLVSSSRPQREKKNTRQSLFMLAKVMHSWMERDMASQVRRRRYLLSYSWQTKFSACLWVLMSCTMAKQLSPDRARYQTSLMTVDTPFSLSTGLILVSGFWWRDKRLENRVTQCKVQFTKFWSLMKHTRKFIMLEVVDYVKNEPMSQVKSLVCTSLVLATYRQICQVIESRFGQLIS